MAINHFPLEPYHISRFDRYQTLRANWEASLGFIARLRERLPGNLSDNVVTVAMAGSFGRLEGALASSDADYIMVVRDTVAVSVQSDQEVVKQAIADLGVSPPNKSGVFAKPRTLKELVDGIGNVNEAADILGKRMLLLLESRPVYEDAAFEEVVASIFDKYVEYVKEEPSKEFVFLLNDLIRYFRFICVNYQSSFWRENERWPIRNLKLRHSRIVMYAGLLFLLGEASKHDTPEKLQTLREALPWTPLDRLAWVYRQNRDHGFFRVAGLYNVFLSKLSDPSVREELNAFEYGARYRIPVFSELKATSDALVAELTRFIWSRRDQWSDRFFEYLVF